MGTIASKTGNSSMTIADGGQVAFATNPAEIMELHQHINLLQKNQ